MLKVSFRISLAVALVLTCAVPRASASLTRIAGPSHLLYESRTVVKFDVAFDTINKVYLLAWGTQAAGPVNGLFLNEAGAPIGSPFTISATDVNQSGWARVLYSAQQGKFIVSYVKIITATSHQKAARFVTYSGGAPALGSEIIIDGWSGGAGTESGMAYSAANGGRFLVTWWKWMPNPVSFVTVIDSNGQIVATYQLTNPGDGQSDPEIACEPASNRCLVVGSSWGAFGACSGYNCPSSTWGRFINSATGLPEGNDSFYIASAPALKVLLEDQTVAPLGTGGQFLVAYAYQGAVLGHVANPSSSSVGAAYTVRAGSDGGGGGYGGTSLIYNAGTQSTMLVTLSYAGLVSVEEIAANGVSVPGTFELIPNPRGDGHWNPWDWGSKFGIAAANPVSSQFLVLDNDYWNDIRATRYSAVPLPPPPPPCTVSLPRTQAIYGPLGAADGMTITSNPSDCSWTTVSNASWIAVTSGASRTGTNPITFSVGRNTSSAVRTGTINVGGQTFTVTQAGMVPQAASVHDLNADGRSDVIWQNQATGQLAAWSLNGRTVAATSYLSPDTVTDTNWKVVGSGDLNGDGYSDLVWRNSATGDLFAWWMQGMQAMDWGPLSISRIADPTWNIAAVGDLNGDGKSDLVWQNDVSGQLVAWFMDGYTVTSFTYLTPSAVADVTWKIAGAGDMNGDGRADLVWHNQATGALFVWFMNGATVMAWGAPSLPAIADLTWKVRGVGDVNGDGRADLLWQNTATGGVVAWYMSDLTVLSFDFLSIPALADTNWRMVGPG